MESTFWRVWKGIFIPFHSEMSIMLKTLFLWGISVVNASLLNLKNTACVSQSLYLAKTKQTKKTKTKTKQNKRKNTSEKCPRKLRNLNRHHELLQQTIKWRLWCKQNVMVHKNFLFSPWVKQKTQQSSVNVKQYSCDGRECSSSSKK